MKRIGLVLLASLAMALAGCATEYACVAGCGESTSTPTSLRHTVTYTYPPNITQTYRSTYVYPDECALACDSGERREIVLACRRGCLKADRIVIDEQKKEAYAKGYKARCTGEEACEKRKKDESTEKKPLRYID